MSHAICRGVRLERVASNGRPAPPVRTRTGLCDSHPFDRPPPSGTDDGTPTATRTHQSNAAGPLSNQGKGNGQIRDGRLPAPIESSQRKRPDRSIRPSPSDLSSDRVLLQAAGTRTEGSFELVGGVNRSVMHGERAASPPLDRGAPGRARKSHRTPKIEAPSPQTTGPTLEGALNLSYDVVWQIEELACF